MNCAHGVRMDRDCRWCATGTEPARPDRELDHLRSERDLLADAVTQYRAQRDAARLEAGRLAQELAELTGKLALAEVEAGRMGEALRWIPITEPEALNPKEVTGG